MITSERENWLITQYVWTLQSEREFVIKGQKAIDDRNFPSFGNVALRAIRKVTGDLLRRCDMDREPYYSPLTIGEEALIVLTLWENMDGSLTISCPHLKAAQSILAEAKEPTPEKLKQEIKQHQENAAERYAKVGWKLERIKQENQMSQIAFQTKSYVYGMDVTGMNEEQLIDAIKKIEAEIANLSQVKVTSKKIDAKKAELTAMLANVVEILDAK